MNEKLRHQIDEWTEADEHQKIVDLIEGLPADERDAEAIGLLARAYNNLGSYAKALELLETTRAEGVDEANWHYRYGYALYFLDREREALRYFERVHELTPDDEDAVEFISECHVRVPFCRRVAEFWQWFTDNEPRLSAITESRADQGEDVVEFVSAGVELLADGVHFNLGGDHEFTFSVEGHPAHFYLYPYVVARMPEQFKGKWHFLPANPGLHHSFGFRMYDVDVNMDHVRLGVEYDSEENLFNLTFYHLGLCNLEEPQALNAFWIILELMVGEGLTYQYIGEVQRTDAPTLGMIALPELRDHIEKTIKAHGKEVFTNPQEVYHAYERNPKEESDDPRDSIMVGTTCFMPLVREYHAGETGIYDRIEAFGARAVFLALSFGDEVFATSKEVLDFRYTLQDRIEGELLAPSGLGLMLGGAIAPGTIFIDILAYDYYGLLSRLAGLLKEYPKLSTYCVQFRKGGEVIRLTERKE